MLKDPLTSFSAWHLQSPQRRNKQADTRLSDISATRSSLVRKVAILACRSSSTRVRRKTKAARHRTPLIRHFVDTDRTRPWTRSTVANFTRLNYTKEIKHVNSKTQLPRRWHGEKWMDIKNVPWLIFQCIRRGRRETPCRRLGKIERTTDRRIKGHGPVLRGKRQVQACTMVCCCAWCTACSETLWRPGRLGSHAMIRDRPRVEEWTQCNLCRHVWYENIEKIFGKMKDNWKSLRETRGENSKKKLLFLAGIILDLREFTGVIVETLFFFRNTFLYVFIRIYEHNCRCVIISVSGTSKVEIKTSKRLIYLSRSLICLPTVGCCPLCSRSSQWAKETRDYAPCKHTWDKASSGFWKLHPMSRFLLWCTPPLVSVDH